MAAVYDRWHTKKPRIVNGEPVAPCKHSTRATTLYPSTDHGKGDRWQVRWRDDTGKQCKLNRPKRGGGKGEGNPDIYAEALAAKIASELNTDTYLSPEAGEITLEQFCKDWRRDHVADPESLETIDRHLAHIYDMERTERTRRAPGSSPIGHRKLRDLHKSPSLMRQWIKSLEVKGLGASYIWQIGITLSSILNVAVEDGRIPRNPMHAKSVRLPEPPERKARPWTREMVEAARAEVDRRHASGGMVDLGAAAGLRLSEVFAFAEEDIFFLGKGRKIVVRRQTKRIRDSDGVYRLCFVLPKGGKEREIPLSDTLSQRLSAQIAKRQPVPITLPWGRPDGKPRTYRLLFVRPNGEPWYRQAFEYTWHKARAKAGAPPPPDENGRFHGLRHTFASMTLAGGADILKLAAWLGHTDPGFTLKTYTHLMPDVTDIGRKAVDAFFTDDADDAASAQNVPEEGKGS